VCNKEFKQYGLCDVKESGEVVRLTEVEHIGRVEQIKHETAVDLSHEQKSEIIEDAIDFFKRRISPMLIMN
jgi:hypothetical protein